MYSNAAEAEFFKNLASIRSVTHLLVMCVFTVAYGTVKALTFFKKHLMMFWGFFSADTMN